MFPSIFLIEMSGLASGS